MASALFPGYHVVTMALFMDHSAPMNGRPGPVNVSNCPVGAPDESRTVIVMDEEYNAPP